jgi:hypothetical protein
MAKDISAPPWIKTNERGDTFVIDADGNTMLSDEPYESAVDLKPGDWDLITAAPDLAASVERLLAVIDALMPGVRYISVQNYAELNDAPIAARAALRKAGRIS